MYEVWMIATPYLALSLQPPAKTLGFSYLLKPILCCTIQFERDKNKGAARQTQRAGRTPGARCINAAYVQKHAKAVFYTEIGVYLHAYFTACVHSVFGFRPSLQQVVQVGIRLMHVRITQ